MSPLFRRAHPEDKPGLPVLRLGHVNGNVTTVGFAMEPNHEDLRVLENADPDELNAHSLNMRTWMLSLPDGQRPYWTHVHQVDHLWPLHSERPPAWVSCPQHPELEQAVADHFSTRGHHVAIGEPEE